MTHGSLRAHAIGTRMAGGTAKVRVVGGIFHLGSDDPTSEEAAARQFRSIDTSSSHIGFRCVLRDH